MVRVNLLKLFIFYIQLASGTTPPLNFSDLAREPKTVYFGDLNFKIHADNTDWYQIPADKIKSKTVQAEFRSLDELQPGRLTVRSESIKKNLRLSEYIRRSAKDYRRFGFKVLDLRPLVINKNQAFLLDLTKEDSLLQTRQILFKQKSNIVILTCTGDQVKFQSDLKSCNQIARNFKWTSLD